MLNALFMLALLFSSLILILLILVQRGKGGGLAGALGGMGGQSAFGTKAGDTFTRITIGVAFAWIVLCILALAILKPSSRLGDTILPASPAAEAPKEPVVKTPVEKAAETPAEKPAEKPAN